MIRKNPINCNLIRVNNSTKSLFDHFMSSFRPESETCPCCKRKGDCVVFASYQRYVIDYINDQVVTSSIEITRVRCSCGHTHAILPDPIIPYDSYSLFFILRVLREHARHHGTVLELCERFCITPSILYRWKHLYQSHRAEWQGLLKTLEQSFLSSLDELMTIDPFSGIAIAFFRKTGLSFMQSHKNPTCSHRSTICSVP